MTSHTIAKRHEAARRHAAGTTYNRLPKDERALRAAHRDAVILAEIGEMMRLEENAPSGTEIPPLELAAETGDGPAVRYADRPEETFPHELTTALALVRAGVLEPPEHGFLKAAGTALLALDNATEWNAANRALAWLADHPAHAARYCPETGTYQGVYTELLGPRCRSGVTLYRAALEEEAAKRHKAYRVVEEQRNNARAAAASHERIRKDGANRERNRIRETLRNLDRETNYSTATILRVLDLENAQ